MMLEHRTPRLFVSPGILPLTSLVGAEFVKAWLETVKLHAFLWSRDIEYGDPNLSNVMYDQGLKCGVLIDYDLSISQQQQPGTDAGSIPFMAIDLLNDEYWKGEIVRLYRHGFEAFLWMLPFVFLRYQDRESQRGTPVDVWMTSNYITCRKEKTDFWSSDRLNENRELCQMDFRGHWPLAEELLLWWNLWLNAAKFSRYMRGETYTDVGNSIPPLWPLFVARLRLVAKKFSSGLGYMDALIDDLELGKPFWVPDS